MSRSPGNPRINEHPNTKATHWKPGQSGNATPASKKAGIAIVTEMGRAAMENDGARLKELVRVLWAAALEPQEWAVKILLNRLCGPDGTLDSLVGEGRVISRIEFVVVDAVEQQAANPSPKEITATYTALPV